VILVTPEKKAELEKLVEESGMPLGEIARRALDAYIEERKRKHKK
jgi:hypothetical protein